MFLFSKDQKILSNQLIKLRSSYYMSRRWKIIKIFAVYIIHYLQSSFVQYFLVCPQPKHACCCCRSTWCSSGVKNYKLFLKKKIFHKISNWTQFSLAGYNSYTGTKSSSIPLIGFVCLLSCKFWELKVCWEDHLFHQVYNIVAKKTNSKPT